MKTCANCDGPVSSHPRAVYCMKPECKRRRNRERMVTLNKRHAEQGESLWQKRRAVLSEDQRRERDTRYGHWRQRNPALSRAEDARRRSLLRDAEVFHPRDVFERDGWNCGICRAPVDPELAWPNPGSASLDHIVPLSKGGEHKPDNTRCTHLRCNVSRGNREDPGGNPLVA